MKTPFLVGKRIYLRPLEREDLNQRYLSWLNDPEVNRFLESGTFPYTQAELEGYYARMTGTRDVVLLAIADLETDQHIGNVKLGPIQWLHRKAAIGLMIGDRQYWRGGYGVEVTRLVIEYGFFRLNLNKIEFGVHAEHVATIRVGEKLGFQLEGRFREGVFHEGRYKDTLWMGLLRSEYARPSEDPAP